MEESAHSIPSTAVILGNGIPALTSVRHETSPAWQYSRTQIVIVQKQRQRNRDEGANGGNANDTAQNAKPQDKTR